MKNQVQTDIVIIGGGIAGLWLLNRLRQMGFSAILFESETLGGGQTTCSQGIIHGGMKYALQGNLTSAAKAISLMPKVWKECLNGAGEVDLSRVGILSERQYLWSTGSLSSKIAGFFAGLTLKSETQHLEKQSFPDIFQHPDFTGQVYALDEMVVDTFSLVRELAATQQNAIFKNQTMNITFGPNDKIERFEIGLLDGPPLCINAENLFSLQEVAMKRLPNNLKIKK